MDFTFNEEQQMLLDSTRRFIAERCGFEARQRVRSSASGYSRDAWAQLGELGLLALNIPEADGGMGAGAIETMLVCNAIGEGLLLEPYLSSAVIATHTIATLAAEQQRSDWLPRLADGSLIAVLAHDEPGSRFDPTKIQTTAVGDGSHWLISGRKSLVYHAPAAGLFLLTARVRGESADALSLFAVRSEQAGITLRACATVDSQRAADIELDRVSVPRAARIGVDIRDGLQAVLDFGLAALCADAFGALDRMLKATIEYSRNRVQFGVPIGSFQALQHRMADMLIQVEQARSMCYLAASVCTDPDAAKRRAALCAAKVLIGQAARFVSQQAVQIHGGMGMTDELSVSHYFKRLVAFELRMGSTDLHLERYRRQMRAA
ncbi:MAG: acyl-CoA dehydrogenase family protein [Pseudomonadota bacterium]|nr:acyl-CoA dehydrogenase family protein [Pseudomonadota bacterium]